MFANTVVREQFVYVCLFEKLNKHQTLIISLILSKICCFPKFRPRRWSCCRRTGTSCPPPALWSTGSRHPALDASSWAITKEAAPTDWLRRCFLWPARLRGDCAALVRRNRCQPASSAPVTGIETLCALQIQVFMCDASDLSRSFPVCHFDYEAGSE